jgi:hypothetical protein
MKLSACDLLQYLEAFLETALYTDCGSGASVALERIRGFWKKLRYSCTIASGVKKRKRAGTGTNGACCACVAGDKQKLRRMFLLVKKKKEKNEDSKSGRGVALVQICDVGCVASLESKYVPSDNRAALTSQ